LSEGNTPSKSVEYTFSGGYAKLAIFYIDRVAICSQRGRLLLNHLRMVFSPLLQEEIARGYLVVLVVRLKPSGPLAMVLLCKKLP
jgi:hypothetical protein